LANIEVTTERRRNEPSSRTWLRYPHREKTFYPLYWPAQAVTYEKDAKRLILPIGRGRKSRVFKLDFDLIPAR
jgi:putative transposase